MNLLDCAVIQTNICLHLRYLNHSSKRIFSNMPFLAESHICLKFRNVLIIGQQYETMWNCNGYYYYHTFLSHRGINHRTALKIRGQLFIVHICDIDCVCWTSFSKKNCDGSLLLLAAANTGIKIQYGSLLGCKRCSRVGIRVWRTCAQESAENWRFLRLWDTARKEKVTDNK